MQLRKLQTRDRSTGIGTGPASRLAAVLALVLLIAACSAGGGGDEEAPANDTADEGAGATDNGGNDVADYSEVNPDLTGELEIVYRSNAEGEGQAIAEAYREARPNVDVELGIVPFESAEFRQSLLTRRLADDLPDVLQSIDRFAQQLADAEITGDMRPFLESGGPVTEDFFAEPFFEQYVIPSGSREGEVHGLPTHADAVVLYYNKDHFDEAGLDYPNEDWTWDDLVEAAAQLTLDEDEGLRYGFTTLYGWHAMYVPMIEARGGSILDDDGFIQFTSPESIDAFEAILGPIQDGIFVPEDVLSAQGDAATAFANGIASMMAGVRGWLPAIRGGIQDDFDVVQFPTIEGERMVGMGSRSLAMTLSGVENEVAHDFFNWYYSEAGGMEILAGDYAMVPPVPELYDSPIWRDLDPPPENNDAFTQAIEAGVRNPLEIPADAQGAIDDGVTQAQEMVLLGGASVEEAFSQVEPEINDAMQRAREDG